MPRKKVEAKALVEADGTASLETELMTKGKSICCCFFARIFPTKNVKAIIGIFIDFFVVILIQNGTRPGRGGLNIELDKLLPTATFIK